MRGMKSGAMVHMQQMRDLMRDSSPAHIRRRQNETPAIAYLAIAGATAPAAARVANTDGRDTFNDNSKDRS